MHRKRKIKICINYQVYQIHPFRLLLNEQKTLIIITIILILMHSDWAAVCTEAQDKLVNILHFLSTTTKKPFPHIQGVGSIQHLLQYKN